MLSFIDTITYMTRQLHDDMGSLDTRVKRGKKGTA